MNSMLCVCENVRFVLRQMISLVEMCDDVKPDEIAKKKQQEEIVVFFSLFQRLYPSAD